MMPNATPATPGAPTATPTEECATLVTGQLPGTERLSDFLQRIDRDGPALNLVERRLLVDQALVLFEQNYTHLPLKMAAYAVDPVQRLRLMRSKLAQQTALNPGPDRQFHADLGAVFRSVRDSHTVYKLPAPYAGHIAFLPFQIEEYWGPDENSRLTWQYVITRFVDGYAAPGLERGARVTHWNGIPLFRAVELQGERFAGSNPAARHARGLATLTLRSLSTHLPPDEEWVILEGSGTDGTRYAWKVWWQVTTVRPAFLPESDEVIAGRGQNAFDVELEDLGQAILQLYFPEIVERRERGPLVASATDEDDISVFDADERDSAPVATPALTTPPLASSFGSASPTTAPPSDPDLIRTELEGYFRVRRVHTTHGTFGHLRIFSFFISDFRLILSELIRLLRLPPSEGLPREGLIIDVRGNTGGKIAAAEGSLQMFTPNRIVPEPHQFINSPLNLRICRAHPTNDDLVTALGPWIPSMEQAVETGATYSAGFPLTPEELANGIGQLYYGPVVLIVDGRCYSATDSFAAGFQDHGIGSILGVDENTGAGGANIWEQKLALSLLEIPNQDASSPYRVLPGGATMSVAIRRALRVNAMAGTPVENLGIVIPSEMRHFLTRRDLLDNNVDLLDRAGQILKDGTVRQLDVTVTRVNGTLTLKLTTRNLERADVFVDGRPLASPNLVGDEPPIVLANMEEAMRIRIEAYAKGKLAATRLLRLKRP